MIPSSKSRRVAGSASRVRRRVFAFAAALVGLCVATAGAEVVLRLIGRGPARLIRETGRPVLHEPDPVLGWRNRPGEYFNPPYSEVGSTTRFTINSDGSRVTRAEGGAPDRPVVLTVGCSYTQGWAISDDETFAWKLQAQHPQLDVRNFGTAGHSTYQALLRLEGLYAQGLRPKVVIYGFIEDHETRNVAPWTWLRRLAAYSNRGHVDVPYCTIDAHGALARHAAERYHMFPLRESLAIVPLFEQTYMQFLTHGRAAQGRAVTEQLLEALDALTRSHGTRLLVAMLAARADAGAHYTTFLKDRGIAAVDCAFEAGPDMRVKGDGHPNGVMNTRFASCIDTALRTITAPFELPPA